MEAKLFDETIIIAADIGGSHITVAPVNLSLATTLQEKSIRMRVDSKGTKEEILQNWLEALKRVFGKFARHPEKLAAMKRTVLTKIPKVPSTAVREMREEVEKLE